MRIQKWIAQLGLASRREAERWIEDGRVGVNGEIITQMGVIIDPTSDRITIDGKDLSRVPPPRVYWLLNKPDETLTARPTDADDRQTIFDIPKLKGLKFQINAVGRLDYRTEGLLLLTNDGELANRLTHPKFHVPRVYHVLVGGKLPNEKLAEANRGFRLEDGPVDCKIQYAHGKNLGKSRGSWYIVTVREGRNRLVRRIFEHFDLKVVRLMRIKFGEITLPVELKSGEYVQLSKDEITSLKVSAGLKKDQIPHET